MCSTVVMHLLVVEKVYVTLFYSVIRAPLY